METETRTLTPEQSQVRMDTDSGIIHGYAMVFNSRSKLLFDMFYEQIRPEAVEGLVKRSDVLALLDHQRARGVLARSEFGQGTLSLTADDVGLRYEFTPPNTALAAEVKEYIVRGDIKGSSFQFVPSGVKDQITRRSDGKYDRTITHFEKLIDVSLVFTPAYDQTSAALRSIAEMEGKTDKKMTLSELNEYYTDLRNQMNKYK